MSTPSKTSSCPLDQTLLAEHALDSGFAIGGALSAQIHLLIVSQDAALLREDDIEIAPGEKPFSEKLVEDIYNQEGAYLEDLEERYGTATADNGRSQRRTEDAILDYAARKQHRSDYVSFQRSPLVPNQHHRKSHA